MLRKQDKGGKNKASGHGILPGERANFFELHAKSVPAGAQAPTNAPEKAKEESPRLMDATSAAQLRQLVETAIKPPELSPEIHKPNIELGLAAVRQIATFATDAHERILELGRVAKHPDTPEPISERAISKIYFIWETGDAATKRDAKGMLEHLAFGVRIENLSAEAERTLKNIEAGGKGKAKGGQPAIHEAITERPVINSTTSETQGPRDSISSASLPGALFSEEYDYMFPPNRRQANTPLDPALAKQVDTLIKHSKATLPSSGSGDSLLFHTGDESDSPVIAKPNAGAQGTGTIPTNPKAIGTSTETKPQQNPVPATPTHGPRTKTGNQNLDEARKNLRAAALKFAKMPVPFPEASITAFFKLIEDKSVKASPAGKELKGISANSAPNEIMRSIAKALTALKDAETLSELSTSERFIVRTLAENALKQLRSAK
jgi:hypothetical protein